MIFALDVLSVKDSPHCFDVPPRFHDKAFAGRLNIAPDNHLGGMLRGIGFSDFSERAPWPSRQGLYMHSRRERDSDLCLA